MISKKPVTKKLPLRPNVCMLVYNREGELLLGKRINRRNHWQFPQGGAEPELSIRENVIREIREELGIKRRKLGKLTKLKSTHQYDWIKPPTYAHGRWRGQSQTFWLVEFLGEDADIDLTADKDPEFKSFRWCSVAEVRRLAAKERLPGYRGALREYSEFRRAALKKDTGSHSSRRSKPARKPTKRTHRDSRGIK
jgi:putative (di)nucleoside polyphosphate hydrolase